MQTITYRYDWTRKRNALLSLTLFVIGLAAAVQLVGSFLESARSGEGLVAMWSQEPVLVSITATVLLLSLCLAGVVLFLHLRPGEPSYVFLRLEEHGLTYSRGLIGRRHWRWRELSSFRLHDLPSYRLITFVFAGKVKWLTGLSPWVQGTTADGPQCMIEDKWEPPRTR